MSSKTILITGGAGYIGSHLAGKLLRKGYKVRVIDKFMFGNEGLRSFFNKPNFKFIKGDIRHIEDLVEAMTQVYAVIDLAAIVGEPACELDHNATLTINYEATKALIEIAKYCKVKRFIFASTCSVYGQSSSILNEKAKLKPLSLYAESKMKSEEVVLNNSGNRLIPTILRLSTIYGVSPRMRFDLVVNILAVKAITEGKIKIYGGKQWRPNLHVQDAAEAFIRCLEAPRDKVNKEIFNVGTNSQNYQIGELGKIVQRYVSQTKIEYIKENPDKRNYRVCFDKIEKELGFRNRKTIKDGILEIRNIVRKGIIKNYKEDKYYNVKYLYR